MVSALDLVLQNPALWRGNECARVAVPGVPTGFAELDAVLPGGGWPAGALTEIYAERPGMGELRLTMPAAAHLTRAERWVALVTPPHVPYAPALAAQGVKLARLLLVQAKTTDEGLWACEQALRTRGCGAVLAWLGHVHERGLKRLQLAAESGGAAALLFRSARVIPPSPAALRLHLGRSGNRTAVRILKRRSGSLPEPVMLDLHGAITERGKIKNKLTADGRQCMPLVEEIGNGK
ncbi:MAG: translesion DNA synthesis-associated protein ImuA [Betaproteobacteria bacterium]|nr:translesion DNA synthesis-associated protein ImuA [Betaproteobacteria bacterium]